MQKTGRPTFEAISIPEDRQQQIVQIGKAAEVFASTLEKTLSYPAAKEAVGHVHTAFMVACASVVLRPAKESPGVPEPTGEVLPVSTATLSDRVYNVFEKRGVPLSDIVMSAGVWLAIENNPMVDRVWTHELRRAGLRGSLWGVRLWFDPTLQGTTVRVHTGYEGLSLPSPTEGEPIELLPDPV